VKTEALIVAALICVSLFVLVCIFQEINAQKEKVSCSLDQKELAAIGYAVVRELNSSGAGIKLLGIDPKGDYREARVSEEGIVLMERVAK
jgi:hypothetical protein